MFLQFKGIYVATMVGWQKQEAAGDIVSADRKQRLNRKGSEAFKPQNLSPVTSSKEASPPKHFTTFTGSGIICDQVFKHVSISGTSHIQNTVPSTGVV